MNNRQIVRLAETLKKNREDWIDTLVKNPNDSVAAYQIMSVNSKIELLRSLWNFGEEGEMP